MPVNSFIRIKPYCLHENQNVKRNQIQVMKQNKNIIKVIFKKKEKKKTFIFQLLRCFINIKILNTLYFI